MIWLFQFAKTGRIKTMKEAIKTFFQYNGRMPSSKEIKNMEGIDGIHIMALGWEHLIPKMI